jgi:peptidoglycan/LPS O-acetylase OafA/YrhL
MIAVALAFKRSFLPAILLFAGCALSYFMLPLVLTGVPYLGFFLAGCVLERIRWNPGRLLVAVSAGLMALVYMAGGRLGPHFWQGPAGFQQRGLELCCVLLALPYVARSLHCKSDRADRMLGDFAYPVYLVHYIMYLAVDNIGVLHRLPVLPRLAVYFGATFAVSVAIFFLIDRPIDRKRKEYVEMRVKLGKAARAPVPDLAA